MNRLAILVLFLAVSEPAYAQVDSDRDVAQVAPQVPLDPVAADYIRYVNSQGQFETSPWAALTERDKRFLLPSAEAFVQLKQADASANFSIVPLAASYRKGTYQLLFRWQQFRADYCNAANPAAGRIRTGVALEIVAEIRSRKNGLNIANLGALTAAAEREHVSGSILIRQIGLGSSSHTLGTYMSNFSLNREGVTKALEAIAVAKAVLENLENRITPHYLSMTEASPGACSAAAPSEALRPLG